MRPMDKLEERVILKLRSKIFTDFKILEKEQDDFNYFSIFFNALKCELQLSHVHFLIYKNVLSENEQFLLSFKTPSLSFFDTWQKDMYTKYLREGAFIVNFPMERYDQVPFDKSLFVFGQHDDLVGILLFKLPDKNHHFSDSFWETLSKTVYQYFEKVMQLCILKHEKKRYKLLQNVTSQLHSTIDIDAVLRKVLDSLEEFYPYFQYQIFLSNYNNIDNDDSRIQPLDYTKSNAAIMETFITGNYKIEHELKLSKRYLYFPLKGKQGIYGVLKIEAQKTILISGQDIEFISILIGTASTAMENAHLYQQSRQLVNDLQLITKVTKKLNANLRLTELVHNISEELQSAFYAEEVGIILFEENQFNVLTGSTPFFNDKDCFPFLQFVKDFLDTREESLFIGNFEPDDNDLVSPFRSIMAESLKREQHKIGFIIVLHRIPYKFSFNTFKLLQSITQHVSLAFTNTILRERLEQLVITDYLTKLYTRNYLDEQMQKSIEKDKQGTFLLIDIDNFKIINDTFGHQVGDQILIQIAKIIKKNLKMNEVGARWGGEELAIYLPNCSLEEGLSLGEQLVLETSNSIDPPVTISCGISHWNEKNKESPFSLFKKADEALYLAKNRGKNRAIASVK